ncbi:MAG TPA: hypothetical protein DEQ14_09585 [Treponema sp.]|nr:hypothetical protein [Treponema sp.]
MKKLIFTVLFLTVFAVLTPVFAQTISEDKASEYYYVNVDIEKIYPSRSGYVVEYRKSGNRMARVYLPNEWFTDAGGKGEIVSLPQGGNWPSMSVYYRSGEFSHVRLFIHKWKGHVTWGNIPLNVNINDRFEGVEGIALEF